MVQWLGLCAPNAGGSGSIPGRRTRAHTLQLRPSAAKFKKKIKKINKAQGQLTWPSFLCLLSMVLLAISITGG